MHGVRLEHGPHDVRRRPEPVGRRAALTLEVAHRKRALGAESLEHTLGNLGVLVEDAPRVPAPRSPEPRVVAGQDERESLVDRLEQLPLFVERIAPRSLVPGDPRVEHEIVASAGDGDRVVLDRAETSEELEHGSGPSLERARRPEQVACDEEPARVLGGDLHGPDASDETGLVAKPLPLARPLRPVRRTGCRRQLHRCP